MVMEMRPEQDEEDPVIIPAISHEIATVKSEKPHDPPCITEEETQELKSRARYIVD